jgi:uncharacterized membrane protein
MPRTPVAVLRAALTMIALAAVMALSAAAARPAGAATAKAACANHYCTKDKPGVRSCRSLRGYQRIARCYIDRAARHYGQSRYEARHIAWRESRYHWWVTNSSAHRGMYQFTDTLWRHTPYHAKSVYSPRYAALAAMWLWRHGGKHHWAL